MGARPAGPRAPARRPRADPSGARGRAGDRSREELLALQRELYEALQAAAPHADAIVATLRGRRRATHLTAERFEHIPPELLAHQMRAVAAAPAVPAMLDHAAIADWTLEAERIACPVRIVWGTRDRLLPWPSAAVRFREWLPQADWVELDGVGHCPQLDVPLETAELILGTSAQ